MDQVTHWLIPWEEPFNAAVEAGMERELRRELCPEHPLFGQTAKLLAVRRDMDDVLFLLAGGQVAEVHLTWTCGVETDPRWPRSHIHASLDEWVRTSMVPTNRWWTDADPNPLQD